MVFASFWNWFAGELFRSTLMLVGGTFLALILIPIFIYLGVEYLLPLFPKKANDAISDEPKVVVRNDSSDDEEYFFRKRLLATVRDYDKVLRDDSIDEEAEVDPSVFVFGEFEHLLQIESPASTRDDLLDWIHASLRGRGMLRYFWSEKFWWVDPPVGPVPFEAWYRPPIALQSEAECTFYVVTIPVSTASGESWIVYKPGITTKSVLGPRGRYSLNSKVDRVVCERKGLTVSDAWSLEQKMLRVMPHCPWAKTFQSELDWLNGIYEVDHPLVEASDVKRLGMTEWRSWRHGDNELCKAVDLALGLTVSCV